MSVDIQLLHFFATAGIFLLGVAYGSYFRPMGGP